MVAVVVETMDVISVKIGSGVEGRSSVTLEEDDHASDVDGTADGSEMTAELSITGTTASLVTSATLVLVLVTSTTSVDVGAGAVEVIVTTTVLVVSGAELTIVETIVSVFAGGVMMLVVSLVCTTVVAGAGVAAVADDPPSTGTTE